MKKLWKQFVANGFKKFVVLLAAVFVFCFEKHLGLSFESARGLQWAFAAYLIGQGLADFGKGRIFAQMAVKERLEANEILLDSMKRTCRP